MSPPAPDAGLAAIDIFSGLEAPERAALASRFSTLPVRRGDVLYVLALDRSSAQGDTQAAVRRSPQRLRRMSQDSAASGHRMKPKGGSIL